MSDFEVIESEGKLIKSWTKGVLFEDAAKEQLLKLAKMPFIHNHIAVMPDVHKGIGSTVGSVIATKSAIIPSACGVDIGCGVIAVKTSLIASQLPDNLAALRSNIEQLVPHGRTDNGGRNDRGAWGNPPDDVMKSWASLEDGFKAICDKYPRIAKCRTAGHLGTLGGGNHFIEVCLDENQNVWIMLHSGSRGVGNAIGSYFIELAKKDMQKWFINLPDADLAYLPEGTEHFVDYMQAVSWAQKFAFINREVMMKRALQALSNVGLPEFTISDLPAVNCHHNYISTERHFGENVFVTRKGAVMAREGVFGVIPGSMGAKSFIVRGKGNRDSFCSCSHGAGRKMSRTAAKNIFTIADHVKATEGVECRKDSDVIDETPAAYKDIDDVMKAQESLVEIVHTLKQVLCVKG